MVAFTANLEFKGVLKQRLLCYCHANIKHVDADDSASIVFAYTIFNLLRCNFDWPLTNGSVSQPRIPVLFRDFNEEVKLLFLQ